MTELTDAAPRSGTMTLEEFKRMRGYDSTQRVYTDSEAPDISSRHHHSINRRAAQKI